MLCPDAVFPPFSDGLQELLFSLALMPASPLPDGLQELMFVSNSDNLGATLDLRLLSFFAGSGKAFLMEV